ncbi:MAG: PEP-CTERM sorting domain-containing protein [Akkermansia muciniphila]|nr:PEP-CTERM sorting domain-containing protein [Akkermansia muciniphila]
MKKTLIALMALAGVALGDITLHGVTFVTAPNQGAYQNWNNLGTTNWQLLNSGNETYGNALTIGGLYIAENSGLKINNGSKDVSLNYLYIDSIIKFATTTAGAVNSVNWSTNEANASLNIKNGGWVDINNDYATRISLENMSTGAVYLNTAGSLTLKSDGISYTLADGVAVYATITDTANVRTLLTGDFSNWNGNVYLMAEDNTAYSGAAYTWKATETGLQIIAVPEPTTATLSLLALVGLAARRRRKLA